MQITWPTSAILSVTFVNRYKGSVAAIQVWNEPNLRGEWVTGNPVNAAEYTDLLKVAYTSAKKATPMLSYLLHLSPPPKSRSPMRAT